MIDMVINILKQKIAEFETEIENKDEDAVKLHAKMIKTLEKKLADIEAREISMWESQVDPNQENRMPQHIFQTLTAKLQKEREETEKALKQAYDTVPKPIDYEQKLIKFQNALTALQDDSKSAAEKNKLLKSCIKRIEYHRDTPYKLKGKGNSNRWSDTPIEITVEMGV
jgi:myosin heavy subunit